MNSRVTKTSNLCFQQTKTLVTPHAGLGSRLQKQLDKLELGGILVSRTAGRTRLYEFNPRYAFINEVKALLEKAIALYSKEDREQLVMVRRLPRRKGKPL